MRELRVEDALYYLDTVKQEFGDRPHIYNEFLDIMKKFKSQEIDTPGVIRRVSTLFHGNRRLVLGFNTFLPEGYKIELPTDENGQAYAVYRTPGQPGVTQVLGPNTSRPMSASTNTVPSVVQQSTISQQVQTVSGLPPSQSQSHHPLPALSKQTNQNGRIGQSFALQSGQQTSQNPLPVQGSVGNNIIQRLGPQPHNVEHGIPMGSFTAQPRHVQHQPTIPAHSAHPSPAANQFSQPNQIIAMASQVESAPSVGHSSQGRVASGSALPGPNHLPTVETQPTQSIQQPSQQHPVEFDHAINYVTTIKKRFVNEPQTYKKFLDILHTYQKEQRGIKEVLDEVSVLFADHPDLLKDFTYFLPDAVQEQAKMQLEQVAKIAEARKMAVNSKQAIMIQASIQRPVNNVSQPTPVVAQSASVPAVIPVQSVKPTVESIESAIPFGATQGRSEEREREICRSSIYGFVSFEPSRPPRKNELTPAQAAQKLGRPRMIPVPAVQPTTRESAFFEKARHHLNRKELAPDKPPGSRRHTPHAEFLKCLHLYGAGILSREELLLLLRGLFLQGHAPKGSSSSNAAANATVATAAMDLMRDFEELLVNRGPYADGERLKKDLSKYGSVPTRDYDFANCEQPTPSYRKYPSDYPYNDFHIFSGRTEADASVLNNIVVCVGHGRTGPGQRQRLIHSPEDYDGIKIRKNVYEDAMAKIEDERFEVNMAIERNFSAMRQVESLAEEVSMLKENEEKDGQPIGRLQYKLRPRSLHSNHIGAIARLYGDYGDEVICHLMKNPLSVLPIVFKRLREKDAEWRKSRTELTQRHWRAATTANYEGSLDVLCYFHRREIERMFFRDHLVEECKSAKISAKYLQKQHQHTALHGLAAVPLLRHEDHGFMLFQPTLAVEVSRFMPHRDAYDLIRFLAQITSSKKPFDESFHLKILAEFLVPFFRLPQYCFSSDLSRRCNFLQGSGSVSYSLGEAVRTLYGDGVIMSKIDSMKEPQYQVQLAFGVAYLRLDSIVHRLKYFEKFYLNKRVVDSILLPVSTHGNTDPLAPSHDFHLFFATENIYVFVRLYCFLVLVLSKIKELIETKGIDRTDFITPFPKLDSNAKATENAPCNISSYSQFRSDYDCVLAQLKDFLKGHSDFKTYETRCRSISKKAVHLAVVLPRLLAKCNNALIKARKENAILPLFGLSLCSLYTDPLLLRARSLELSQAACYRIQYHPDEGKSYFSFLPKDKELVIVSGSSSQPCDSDESMRTAIPGHAERRPTDEVLPHPKRFRFK